MAWISIIEPGEAKDKLAEVYARVNSPAGEVDNILKAHSHRPHTLEGHMALYKAVLHHPGNALPHWFLETIGLYVSLVNGCRYCVEHHYAGLTRLVDDEQKTHAIWEALAADAPMLFFQGPELAALQYAKILTERPQNVRPEDIELMRRAGLDDGQILEVNQVAAYFAYANRVVLGLGVDADGDALGLSPSDTEDTSNWEHT